MKSFLFSVLLFVAFVYMAQCVKTARAAEPTPWTVDDTYAAIEDVSVHTGLSYRWLYRIVSCETGGTFDPYSRGAQGELGPVQLHPYGMLRTYYAEGFTDPFNPYHSMYFLAEHLLAGESYKWSCA